MGSASSQLNPTQAVTPPGSEAAAVKESIDQSRTATSGIDEFCPIERVVKDKIDDPGSTDIREDKNATSREKQHSNASSREDMARKNDAKTAARPSTPVAADRDRNSQFMSLYVEEDPNTQLRHEMMASQKRQDARSGENRHDESPTKKKKERKKKKKTVSDVSEAELLMEAGMGAPEDDMAVQEEESAAVVEPVKENKKRKRKSKAEEPAQQNVENVDAPIQAGSGWQTVNTAPVEAVEEGEAAERPAKKRKRKSKAADAEEKATTAESAEQVQATPKPKKQRKKSTAVTQAPSSTPRVSTEGFAGLPKSGAFTGVEIELITSTIEDFCQAHEFTLTHFNNLVENGVSQSPDLGELVKDLMAILPNRNSQSLRRFMERKYHNCKRGAWSHEEDEELRQAFAEKPNKWREIAHRLNRKAEDCRDRWRNHAQYSHDQRNKDVWSEAEEQELLDAIETCITRMQESGLLPEGADSSQIPEDTIQWKVVSELMDGKRNRLQCAYKWKKLKYRAWRADQVERGILPPKRTVRSEKTGRYLSNEWVPADFDEEGVEQPEGEPMQEEEAQEGQPEQEEAQGQEMQELAQNEEEGGAVHEPTEYRDDTTLNGIARTPEDSDERHAQWHQRYDIGDWYSMLREMFESYAWVRAAKLPHHQYWAVVQQRFDHGHWDNDDRMRSLDRCCRGLGIPKTGLRTEIMQSLLTLEHRSRRRDLEQTVMGRRRWKLLSKTKQYVTPSDSVDGVVIRRASNSSRTPVPSDGVDVDHSGGIADQPEEEAPEAAPASEHEAAIIEHEDKSASLDDNEPINVDDEEVVPAATLDENDPSFWDPVSPPSQTAQSKAKRARAEKIEAGPSTIPPTKKRASYGKMSKRRWTPAQQVSYEDSNDPIEDSQTLPEEKTDVAATGRLDLDIDDSVNDAPAQDEDGPTEIAEEEDPPLAHSTASLAVRGHSSKAAGVDIAPTADTNVDEGEMGEHDDNHGLLKAEDDISTDDEDAMSVDQQGGIDDEAGNITDDEMGSTGNDVGSAEDLDATRDHDDESEPEQSYAGMKVEPELGSPTSVASSIVRDTQLRPDVDDDDSSVVSTSSEDASIQHTPSRRSKLAEDEAIPASDDDMVVQQRPRQIKRARRDEDLDLGSVNGRE